MGLLDRILIKSKKTASVDSSPLSIPFNQEEYDRYNSERVKEFFDRNDLESIEGIMAIPISEAKMYPDGGKSVVYMAEQILNRKATEYKKGGRYEYAVACLIKANELSRFSYYTYNRDYYERVVNLMVEARMFEQAKKTHKELDSIIGTSLNELHDLQKSSCTTMEEFNEYTKTIIEPRKNEERDREIYYYLLENFSEIAPKSFSGFRKMRNANSVNYLKILSVLSNKGINIDSIKFWF